MKNQPGDEIAGSCHYTLTWPTFPLKPDYAGLDLLSFGSAACVLAVDRSAQVFLDLKRLPWLLLLLLFMLNGESTLFTALVQTYLFARALP